MCIAYTATFAYTIFKVQFERCINPLVDSWLDILLTNQDTSISDAMDADCMVRMDEETRVVDESFRSALLSVRTSIFVLEYCQVE